MKSPFTLHVEKWTEGCGSDICDGARKVFCRGTLPCEVLFVGEAPGESEDTLGRPFVGPAGKLMDSLINRALPAEVTLAFTNLVCCIPRVESGGKAGQPPDEAVQACQPRLGELVEMAEPKLVACVGKFSEAYLDPMYRHALKLPPGVQRVNLIHPAFLLRANHAQRGLLEQRWVVTLRNAYNALEER